MAGSRVHWGINCGIDSYSKQMRDMRMDIVGPQRESG